MGSYLSQPETDALQSSNLHRNTPFLIQGASNSYIARHYGACEFKGDRYLYLADSDELIRDDVLAFVKKLRKPKRKGK